jgi:hypothetical protein
MSTRIFTSRSRRRVRRRLVLVTCAAGAALALLAGWLAFAAGRSSSTATAPGPADPGAVHVHGLGVDPVDRVLYAATHTGLFRISEDGSAERVGDRYHDLMGFTVAAVDDFVASGHPDLRDDTLQRSDAPPLLGLVTSADRGASWQEGSLLGETDFHTLQAGHGQIYGWDATGGRFMVSSDRKEWETRSEVPLTDFAVSPEDPEVVIGTTAAGVVRSDDGGRSWTPDGEHAYVAVEWSPEALWAVAADGRLDVSTDGGRTWESRGTLEGPPEAFEADGDLLIAALPDRGIVTSSDAGATWSLRYQPESAQGGA